MMRTSGAQNFQAGQHELRENAAGELERFPLVRCFADHLHLVSATTRATLRDASLMEPRVSGSGHQGGGTIYTALALDRCRRCPDGSSPVDQHERRSGQGRLSSRYRSAQRQIERPGALA
jgi:hypothetical protein